MSEDFIKKAPIYAFKNKEAVATSQRCGCYNCLNIINTEDIEFWTDDDETALCPNCTLDTLIAESLQVPLDKETLQKIRDHWIKR